DLTWTRGRHHMKFGAKFQHSYQSSNGEAGAGGWSFTNRITGLPGVSSTGVGYASYLLGEVDSVGLGSGGTGGRFYTNTWGFYGQDSWRVTSRLTLNYGLRWDLFLPMHEGFNRFSSFDPTIPNPGAAGHLGSLVFWGSPLATTGPLYPTNGRTGLYETY